MIGIYKIINLNNNKLYIGRSNNIERRWKDHLQYSNNPSSREYHSPLHRAIRKYGIDSFVTFLKINLKRSNIVRNIFLAPDDFCNFS